MTIQEKIQKQINTKNNFDLLLAKAIESSLTTKWQPFNDFARKVRAYCKKDLEWLTIGIALRQWIAGNSKTEEIKNDKGKCIKKIVHSPVEWKNPHTDYTELRLIK